MKIVFALGCSMLSVKTLSSSEIWCEVQIFLLIFKLLWMWVIIEKSLQASGCYATKSWDCVKPRLLAELQMKSKYKWMKLKWVEFG